MIWTLLFPKAQELAGSEERAAPPLQTVTEVVGEPGSCRDMGTYSGTVDFVICVSNVRLSAYFVNSLTSASLRSGQVGF